MANAGAVTEEVAVQPADVVTTTEESRGAEDSVMASTSQTESTDANVDASKEVAQPSEEAASSSEVPKTNSADADTANGKDTSSVDVTSEKGGKNDPSRVHVSNPGFRHMHDHLVEKYLKSISPVEIVKMQKIKQWAYCFVQLKNEEEAQQFRDNVDGNVYKRKPVKVNSCITSAEIAEKKKRKREELEEGGQVEKKQKTGPTSIRDMLRYKLDRGMWRPLADKVSPLHKMPYDEQCKLKWRHIKSIMKGARKDLVWRCGKEGVNVPKWAEIGKRKVGIKIADIVESPPEAREGYRNKCEFTVGYAPQANSTDALVGFVSTVRDCEPGIEEPSGIIHVPDAMKELATHFQQVIRDSPFPPAKRKDNTGVWRVVTARLSEANNEMMVIFQARGDQEGAGIAELTQFITEKVIKDKLYKDIAITSAFIQTNDTSCDAADFHRCPMTHIYGKQTIDMKLMNKTFAVQPQSFFQTNIVTCEKLYTTATDLLECDKESTVLLDVCCGVGTIGQCVAEKVKKVVGIEMVQEAIDDAEVNAKNNKLDNCVYHCGKAEHVIPRLLDDLEVTETDNVVALVDPPRAGLHASVLSALRSSTHVRKLVYISCNPTTLEKDVATLCNPTVNFNDPFVPLKAVPVDMFPHTLHVESIVLLERASDHEELGEQKSEAEPDGEDSDADQEQKKDDEKANA